MVLAAPRGPAPLIDARGRRGSCGGGASAGGGDRTIGLPGSCGRAYRRSAAPETGPLIDAGDGRWIAAQLVSCSNFGIS
ncbi:MAG: hypothetical protein JW986_07950 [Methanotrichaceae archaeon]|nr:hypothetical protein [Methanotrichaceae archaeon]